MNPKPTLNQLKILMAKVNKSAPPMIPNPLTGNKFHKIFKIFILVAF